MRERSKGRQWTFMFTILILVLAAASAIAYGIISQYFHH